MGENGIGCRGSGARGGCRVLRGAGCDLAKAVGGEPEAGQDQGWAANMKDGSLEHLDIYVSDLARSGEFWGAFLRALGYREFAKSPTGWSWTNDESTVFLLQAEPEYLDPPYHRKRVGMNHLAFGVSSKRQVDALATSLKARRVPLLYGGPRRRRPTHPVIILDPDRIKIEVAAPVGS